MQNLHQYGRLLSPRIWLTICLLILFSCFAQAQLWTFHGLSGHYVTSLRFSTQKVFACAGRAGLFQIKREPISNEWEYLGLGEDSLGGGIIDLAIDNTSEGTLLAALRPNDPHDPGIFRSTDGGLTWNISVNGFGFDPPWYHPLYPGLVTSCSVLQTDSGNPGFVLSGSFYTNRLFFSQDFGLTWAPVQGYSGSIEASTLSISQDITRPHSFVAGGDNGDGYLNYLHSEDGGLNWKSAWPSPLLIPDNWVRSIMQIDSTVVLISARGVVIGSFDHGQSWDSLHAMVDPWNEFYFAARPHHPSEIVMGGGEELLISQDSGKHWSELALPGTSEPVTAIAWDPEGSTLWIALLNGGVFSTIPSSVNSISREHFTSPNGSNLIRLTSFPNPANPGNIIQVDCKVADHYVLEVFDLKGTCVRRLFSGLLEKGEHNFRWDGTSETSDPISSGVYIVRIRSSILNSQLKIIVLK